MFWDIEAERLKAQQTRKPMPIIKCRECGDIIERIELTLGMIRSRLCPECLHDRLTAFKVEYGL